MKIKKCCQSFKNCEEMLWRLKDWRGPDEDGWCAIKEFDSLDSYVLYINIQYCPFCGAKL